MTNLLTLPAVRLAELIRSREVSPVEVVEAHLARIEAVNPALNAITTSLAGQAREEAHRAEAALQKGEAVGPLHGVPITVKETLDMAGVRSTGCVTWNANRVAARDATAVARMRAAGAIVLARTNSPDAALAQETVNPIFGRTNNPWALNRSAGGSSGGEAAIIAAGGSPLGVGTDMGGSIRIPSTFCGVVGFKPSHRLIPSDGNCPEVPDGLEDVSAVGALGRTVDDVALAMGIMAARPEIATLDEVALGGRPAVQMTGNGMAPISGEVRSRIDEAVRALADAGMVRGDHRLRGSFHTLWLWLDRVFRPSMASYLAETEAGAPSLAALPRAAWQALWGRGPVSGPVMWAVVMGGLAGLAIWPFHRMLSRMREAMLEDLFRVAGDGVVVLPAFPTHPPRHNWTYFRFIQTVYFLMANALSAPALIIPAGVGRAGLPLAVQIIGPPGADRVVLAAGRVVEAALGGWRGPVEPDSARRKR
jgi:Asp-tRNA(Asn)/Glu-tRNA(Gln) amidotransferase A subunit family amidase